jgi:hypothetical protein
MSSEDNGVSLGPEKKSGEHHILLGITIKRRNLSRFKGLISSPIFVLRSCPTVQSLISKGGLLAYEEIEFIEQKK